MPNTREKLIELIKRIDGVCPKEGDCKECEFCNLDECYFPAKADYLLANGVTIPVRCDDCRLHMNCPREEQFYMVKAKDRYCCLGERRENDG